MKNIIKTILVAAFAAFVFAGCRYPGNGRTATSVTYHPAKTDVQAPAFNEEVYVWEEFNFSTNLVENAK